MSHSELEQQRIAAKLAARYPPPRFPRGVLVAIVGVVAVVFCGWLVWVAWLHAEPAVSGQVSAFAFPTDTRAQLTVTIQRRDGSRPAVCRVVVQAANFEDVGEKDFAVPANHQRLVDVKDSVRTLRRGTSASVQTCQVTG